MSTAGVLLPNAVSKGQRAERAPAVAAVSKGSRSDLDLGLGPDEGMRRPFFSALRENHATMSTARRRLFVLLIYVVAEDCPETDCHNEPEANHEENQPVVGCITVMFGTAH